MNTRQKIAQRLEMALIALHRPPSLPPRGPGGWAMLAARAVFASVAVEKTFTRRCFFK